MTREAHDREHPTISAIDREECLADACKMIWQRSANRASRVLRWHR
jgi:hypothetical protein